MNTRDKLREAFIRWFQDFGMDNLTNVSIVNQDFFFLYHDLSDEHTSLSHRIVNFTL